LSDYAGKQFYFEDMSGGQYRHAPSAKKAPDGYTLLTVSPSYVINPTLYGKVLLNSKTTSTR